jgi:hypothetical protein
MLNAHPKIQVVGLGGEAPVYPLVGFLVNGKMELWEFMERLERVAIHDRDMGSEYNRDEPRRMSIAFGLLGIVPEEKKDYIGVFSHLYPPRFQGRYWINDMLQAGYDAPIVVPLRDPAQILASLYIKARGNTEAVRETLELVRFGFRWLNDESPKNECCFVPVDLLAQMYPQPRHDWLLLHLFSSFLEVGDSESIQAPMRAWDRMNETRKALNFPMAEELWEVKFRAAHGRDCRGLYSPVDWELERMNALDNVKEIYRTLGYRLPWMEA